MPVPKEQLSTTSFMSIHFNSWAIVIIFSAAIMFTIIILIAILYHCNCFPRRRSKNRASSFTSSDAIICTKNHSSSSVKKRLLSSNGSEHVINMAPLECGMIKPGNFCEKEFGDLSVMRQYYSRICHWFSMNELIEATDNFHSRNLIGVGCYGNVYRGFLLDGTRVAVKEFTLTRFKAEQFRQIVEEIPDMTHKNLVKMIGFCMEEFDLCTRFIIVSEYVDNGSLHQWLHAVDAESTRPFSWTFRVDIISGIAKGLAYLHEDVGQKIVHANLQSHKILLDRQWNPKISDFAVARLLDHTREMNEKEDVFRFGLLVIEIISGRKLIENNRHGQEVNLLISSRTTDKQRLQLSWLKFMIANQNYEQIVDPKVPQLPPLKELKRVLLIALRCADLDAEKRPQMGEVLHMLEPRDLLLCDGQDVYRRSYPQDCQVFSDSMLVEDHVSDYDLRDDETQLKLCYY